MRKDTEGKVANAIKIVDASSSVLSVLHPAFSGLPLVIYAINRVIEYESENNIINRMKKLERKLDKKKISMEEFREKVVNLTEHDEYVVRNNLINVLLNCIPESVDIYISVLIDLIMNQENTIHEEICEILSQLNKNDLIVLSMINFYRKNGENKYYYEHIEKNKENEQKNNLSSLNIKLIKFTDRDNIYKTYTIFWKDFTEQFSVSTIEMGQMLLSEGIDENENFTMQWAFLARAFIKLERLGLIQMDIQNTLGTINFLNVDRFHITLFGHNLLYYVDLNDIENGYMF